MKHETNWNKQANESFENLIQAMRELVDEGQTDEIENIISDFNEVCNEEGW